MVLYSWVFWCLHISRSLNLINGVFCNGATVHTQSHFLLWTVVLSLAHCLNHLPSYLTVFWINREAKIGEKQSRQSNSKYNFMQHVFFEKGICSVQWGLPRKQGIFENFYSL